MDSNFEIKESENSAVNFLIEKYRWHQSRRSDFVKEKTTPRVN